MDWIRMARIGAAILALAWPVLTVGGTWNR